MSTTDKHDPYAEWGGRPAYLRSLADDYGVPLSIVLTLADLLGPDEDFDGLIVHIEDAGGEL